MKISIVIAYHDEKKYIKDCLSSLADQTYKDFDVIVVCDGCEPPDVSEYPELHISFVQSKGVSCVAAIRNLGLEHATGEFVYFLDSDDYIEKDDLEKLIHAQKDGELVYGDMKHTWYSRKVYYDNGEELDRQNETNQEDLYVGDVNNPYDFLISRAKTFQDITILGMLIPKQLIDANSIRFLENLHYFSDIPFLLQVLECAKTTIYCREGGYIKRKHNDPVNLPSLLQKKDDEVKTFESIQAYMDAKKYMSDKDEDNRHFDYKFAMCLVTQISPFMIESNVAKRKEVGLALQEAIKLMGNGVWKMLGHHPKKLIRHALNGDSERIVKKTIHHSRKQTLFRVCTSRAKMKRYLYEKVFSKMKMMDNMVVFESFFGKSYSDSPKYIYEYLNKKYPGKYQYMWVNAGKKLTIPYQTGQMKRFSFKYFFYMARSKYIVFNGRQPQYFIKRKGNVFLETWHGTPLKKLVFDMDDVTTASPLYKEQFYIQTRSWDYLVAPNQFSEDIFRHAFMYDGKMLQTGYPRNDILYRENTKERIREIKNELNIPMDKKVILYAPTWRDDEFYGHAQYKFTLQLDLDQMQKALGDEYVVILRTHYFIADFLDLSGCSGFAYNLSKYDDIAKLYLISDVLITDYSSVFFDYANLKRPMLFFTYDLEKYRSVLRGFYMNVEEELPGPMLFNTDEVIGAVQNIDHIQTEYKDKYEDFYHKYCAWEDGHATEKVVNAVFQNEEN